MTRGFAPTSRGTFVSAKVPKATYPTVDVQGCTNAASGRIHRSGLRLYCFSRRLAALRFPCSRLQVQGLPSVASPFSGTKVHRTFVFYPLYTYPAPSRGRAMYRDVRVPRVQDAYERPSAALVLGLTVGAAKKLWAYLSWYSWFALRQAIVISQLLFF